MKYCYKILNDIKINDEIKNKWYLMNENVLYKNQIQNPLNDLMNDIFISDKNEWYSFNWYYDKDIMKGRYIW